MTAVAYGALAGDLYTVRPDGSDLRRLTTTGVASWPEWTPAGQIRFRGGGPNQFWLMDADGENPQMLVDLSAAFATIDPPGRVSNISVPGDPGRTFHWQPAGLDR
jgi:hypothetical protein